MAVVGQDSSAPSPWGFSGDAVVPPPAVPLCCCSLLTASSVEAQSIMGRLVVPVVDFHGHLQALCLLVGAHSLVNVVFVLLSWVSVSENIFVVKEIFLQREAAERQIRCQFTAQMAWCFMLFVCKGCKLSTPDAVCWNLVSCLYMWRRFQRPLSSPVVGSGTFWHCDCR